MSRSRASTKLLYRQILKAASSFPSKNKLKLIEEIKSEFKLSKTELSSEIIESKIAIAIDGLDRLRAFSGLDGKSNEWVVRLKGPSTEEQR